MLRKIIHITPDLLLKSNYRFFRHMLIQLIVLLITVNILWDEPTQILPGRFVAWIFYILLFNMVIYTNIYFLVPVLLLKGKYKSYTFSTLTLILVFVFSVGMLQSVFGNGDSPVRTPALVSISSGFAAFALFIAGLTALQLFRYGARNLQRIRELENATMAIELANLQNQINPHFLFNMLNNANIIAAEDVEKSSRLLKNLNDLLQYQVENSSDKLVNLKDDIVFLKDYLELEKMRRDRFSYSIHGEGNLDIELPPLLFIPFVENAVKHNPENDSHIDILFRVTANTLHFECRNPKAQYPQQKKQGGIGILNIKRRLSLLFERDFLLTLNDEKESYTAIMEINREKIHEHINRS